MSGTGNGDSLMSEIETPKVRASRSRPNSLCVDHAERLARIEENLKPLPAMADTLDRMNVTLTSALASLEETGKTVDKHLSESRKEVQTIKSVWRKFLWLGLPVLLTALASAAKVIIGF